ncbi:hypothetical protein BO85DRAFT_266850 [Aspergillus piperis CBS 112811]|uniref:Uncharacterized protein n=1 Tax=Aspergillus piperis CBS 112811 TaxID=1448313 RepID=A0A8G1R472_9EURO|nr:hypothetical protein BO85DRAFT_266850 [Aspergillus piperis CBS 112811]RAH59248.1 hypothetical protein BO85DRAFT_266850 [Aspergillus piperis CBS 112811]
MWKRHNLKHIVFLYVSALSTNVSENLDDLPQHDFPIFLRKSSAIVPHWRFPATLGLPNRIGLYLFIRLINVLSVLVHGDSKSAQNLGDGRIMGISIKGENNHKALKKA